MQQPPNLGMNNMFPQQGGRKLNKQYDFFFR